MTPHSPAFTVTAALSAAIPFVLATLAVAQGGPPGPAAELQKLAPLVGNWGGTGTATFGPGAPPTKWEARGTYRWCLDGNFLQEDFEIVFAGQSAPMLFRTYLGWDRENQRYVAATANNSGDVRLHEVTVLPDGTLMQLMMQSEHGQPNAERSLLKVVGDTMTHSIDLLLMSGPSLSVVDGTFHRGGKGFDGAMEGAAFAGAAADPAIARLGRSAGIYQVHGEMIMPGMPAMTIQGTDTARACWGGTVVHVHTDGSAEGMPGDYHGDVLWGHDAARHCLVGVFVSNMGEVSAMDGYWRGSHLVCTSSGLMMGEPTVQRMVMDFDDQGATTKAVAHSIAGTAAPLQAFQATYKKQK